jgi:hypothetical protein
VSANCASGLSVALAKSEADYERVDILLHKCAHVHRCKLPTDIAMHKPASAFPLHSVCWDPGCLANHLQT